MIRKALVVITWKPSVEATEKKVLVLKLIPERGGFWQPVTGKVDEGEEFAEGALREAEEETGFRFERRPQYMGLEYEFVGKEGKPALERAYFLPLFGGAHPPEPKLDPKEHVDFEWVDPEEAVARVKYPTNKKAIERVATAPPPLFLSRSGSFFQDGEAITHERTAELLHRSLQKTGSGFLVRMGEEELDVVVEDTPRFVRSYDRETGECLLSSGEKERLNPESLRVRGDHSFVCTTKEGWQALFLSPAYYELTKCVEESDGKYLLHFLGRDYPLAIPS